MKPYPDHPKARSFVNIGLFDELESFEQLNQRIFDLGLEMNQNDRNGYRGAAFEVFVEALVPPGFYRWRVLSEIPRLLKTLL